MWISGVKAVSHATGLSSLLAKRHAGVRILMFHEVGGEDYSTREFERQITYVRDRYDLVSIDEALEALATNQRHSPPKLLLTFDDGLRNHFQEVYPVLVRLVVPAVFYVCPGLIERQQWLWNHDARARIEALAPEARRRFTDEAGAPDGTPLATIEWLKLLPAPRRRDVTARLQELTPEFTPTAAQHQRFDLMSWAELLSLDPRLVTVGSHTLTHPILTGLEPEEAFKEVRASRDWLEDRLKRPVQHFCFPNGLTSPAVTASLNGIYRSAVTTVQRIARHGDDPMALPRLSAAKQLERLSWRLHRPTP